MANVGALRTFGAPAPLTLGVRPHQTTIVAFPSSHHLSLSELAEVLAALPQDVPITVERVRPHNKGEIRHEEQTSAVELTSQLLRAYEEEHLPGGDREVVIGALGKRLIAHHDGVFWLKPLN